MICIFLWRDLTSSGRSLYQSGSSNQASLAGEPGQDNLQAWNAARAALRRSSDRAKAIAEIGQIKEDIDAH
jgi:hypothetical protein